MGSLVDRFLELLAVILLGVATVATAWCGLQSALWSGEQDRIAVIAAGEHADATRLFGLATQAVSYDAMTVAEYAQAVNSGNQQLRTFYRSSLVRKEFLKYLDSWEQEVQAGQTPTNLLEDENYLADVLGPYRKALAQAEADDRDAESAGRIGDFYVLSTVILAVALFFAGVTGTFRSPTLRLVMLAICVLTIAVSLGRLADLPVADATWALLGSH